MTSKFSSLLASGLLFASTQGAYADTSDNAYTAFLASLSALTTSSDTIVQGDRNNGRLTKMRQLVTAKLVASLGPPPTSNPASPSTDGASLNSVATEQGWLADSPDLDEKYLLCNFRWDAVKLIPAGSLSKRDSKASLTVDHLAALAAQNYLNSVLTQLKGITPPKATDVPSAIKQLFNSYQIKAPTSGLQPSGIKEARRAVQKSCESDLKEFDTAFYGQHVQIGPAPASAASVDTGLPSLSFLGPYGSAFDSIATILAPVLIDLSNLVASWEQAKEVKDYLGDTKTKAALTKEGEGLGRAESDYLFAHRLVLAGTFAEQVAVIKATTLDLHKISECNVAPDAMVKRSDRGAPSLPFMLCYRAVWAQYQSAVDNAMKTANDYDQLADAGDTSSALDAYSEIVDRGFDNVVNSSTNNPQQFWAAVNQLLTFAGAVANATSGSNLVTLKRPNH